jgi:hypothetical protein
MAKLTPLERAFVYQIAEMKIRNCDANTMCYALCVSLSILQDTLTLVTPDEISVLFPEYKLFKPKVNTGHYQKWFTWFPQQSKKEDINNRKTRQTILLLCYHMAMDEHYSTIKIKKQ